MCSVPSIPKAPELVADAVVIVVVEVPQDYAVLPKVADSFWSRAELEMRVLRVLKGSFSGSITVPGTLEDEDDFNDRPVPYDFIRTGGRHGNCRATNYRRGAAYLFLVPRRDGRLTPHGAAFAPTNEQLRPIFRQCPWFKWVKKRLRHEPPADDAQPIHSTTGGECR